MVLVVRQGPPELGVTFLSPQIKAAVAAARRSQVAIVFADEVSSEGADQTGFSLPGDENALIAAVAAVNSHTIVVLIRQSCPDAVAPSGTGGD